MSKSKLTLIAALAVVGIASPVFAQSREVTGSTLPHYWACPSTLVWGAWGPLQTPASINHIECSAQQSYAGVPSGAAAFAAVSPDDPLGSKSK